MSDVAWLAMVAIIGPIITGLVAYFITKSQIDSQNKDRQQDRVFQQLEAKRLRFIEARRPYLISLRETFGEWANNFRVSGMLGMRAKAAQEQHAENYAEEVRLFGESMERGQEIAGKLAVLRAQVDDGRLQELLDKTEEFIIAENLVFLRATEEFNRPQVTHWEMELPLEKFKAASVRIRAALGPVNRRIQELLAGEDANDFGVTGE